jgi:HlyD family secretion protein
MTRAEPEIGPASPQRSGPVPAAAAQTERAANSPAAAPAKPAASKSAPADAPPTPARRRRLWPLLLLIALAGTAAGGAFYWHREQQLGRQQTELVLQGNIDVRQVNLAFKVDGRIAQVSVDEGDTVAEGTVVATLDRRYFDDDLRATQARRDNSAAALARLEHGSRPEEIAEARAQVTEQRTTLARTRRDYDRSERLIGKGAVSQEVFDQTKAAFGEAEARMSYLEEALHLAEIGPRQEDIDAARAQLAAADVAVVQSQRRLDDSQLIAPSAGIVLTRAREKGAIVAAGETVYTLTLTSTVWVRTYVNERDLGHIQPGMRGDVRTDSAPNKVYRGQIGFISPKAEFTPKTVETRELRTDLVYRLRVIVDNPDGGLRQGMPVTVTLDLDPAKSNQALPEATQPEAAPSATTLPEATQSDPIIRAPTKLDQAQPPKGN